MSDDKKKVGSPDTKLISLKEDYEVQYWTNRFLCSKEDLILAVESTKSHSVTVVESWLEENGYI